MPIPPSRYVSGPVASQQLNTDLYGYPGVPSGVAFHASRPLLSETVIKGGTAYSPLIAQPVQGNGIQAYTVVDTTALTGPGADYAGPYAAFRFANYVPASGGSRREHRRPVADLEFPGTPGASPRRPAGSAPG